MQYSEERDRKVCHSDEGERSRSGHEIFRGPQHLPTIKEHSHSYTQAKERTFYLAFCRGIENQYQQTLRTRLRRNFVSLPTATLLLKVPVFILLENQL